ncbi:MAG: hypothetical protein ABH879_05910 [archaeon]
MNEFGKKQIERIWNDFQRLKTRASVTASDEEKLIDDVTGLIGIYIIDRAPDIEAKILEMIEYGEKKRFLMSGCRYELNRAKYNLIAPARLQVF